MGVGYGLAFVFMCVCAIVCTCIVHTHTHTHTHTQLGREVCVSSFSVALIECNDQGNLWNEEFILA